MSGEMMINGIDVLRIVGIIFIVLGIIYMYIRRKMKIPFWHAKSAMGLQNGSGCIIIGAFLVSSSIVMGLIVAGILLIIFAAIHVYTFKLMPKDK